MTILLDTHTLLWFLENDPQLPNRTRIRIQTSTTVFISIANDRHDIRYTSDITFYPTTLEYPHGKSEQIIHRSTRDAGQI